MYNQHGMNNHQAQPTLLKGHQFQSSPIYIGKMGQIQSHRTFSTTPTMGSKSTKCCGTAKIINSENGYPNNMRKTIGEDDMGTNLGQGPGPSIPEVILDTTININITSSMAMGPSSTPMIAIHNLGSGSHLELLQQGRLSFRKVSECPSEDSYIIFEGCADSDDDDDYIEAFLTDDSDDDDSEADCDESGYPDIDEEIYRRQKTDALRKHCENIKKVHFAEDEHLAEVHRMVTWSFAYRASRKGHWEEYARDRDRFNRRIFTTELLLERTLSAPHRERVFQERFAPQLAKSDAPNRVQVNASDHQICDNANHNNKKKRHGKRRNGKKKKRRNRFKCHKKR